MNSDGLTKPPNKRKLDLVKSRVQTAISGLQTEHIIKRRQMEHGSKYLLHIAQARTFKKSFGETLRKAYTRSNLRTDLAALSLETLRPPSIQMLWRVITN